MNVVYEREFPQIHGHLILSTPDQTPDAIGFLVSAFEKSCERFSAPRKNHLTVYFPRTAKNEREQSNKGALLT